MAMMSFFHVAQAVVESTKDEDPKAMTKLQTKLAFEAIIAFNLYTS